MLALSQIAKLLRPHQWLKNGFIFLPLFFDKHILDWEYLYPCLVSFLSFCFAASSIYCFNDILDADVDKFHPTKCLRPIASGAVSKTSGYVILVFCFILSLGLLAICGCNIAVLYLFFFYYILNIVYCIKLKSIAIVDVFCIACGFVLRVLVGGFASGVLLSHWIILMTFLLALFLAFAKRRDDVVIYEETGVKARMNVCRYNVAFMNQAISVVASITMICYIMYTVTPEVIERFGSRYLYVTSIFVLAGIIRYLQLTIVDDRSGSPTKILLRDHFIHACIIGWILAFVVIIYL